LDTENALACPFHAELAGKEKGGFGMLGIKGSINLV
jgi:hypothetical protein